ncbi:hypothetical protein C8Q72DRAFT_778626 [Fomitopsis betulina]|nr:hypothetical protein C8Q72DRAFT_778626 [Fomitopsis betulina]
MSPSANSQAPTASRDDTDAENGSDGYPEQRHAGAVGLGPEFGRGVTTGDKIEGYKEELKGKILRKPDVVQHGHDLRTGELKRREDAENNVVRPLLRKVASRPVILTARRTRCSR